MSRSQRALRYREGVDVDNVTAWERKEPSRKTPEQQNALATARGTTPPTMPATTGITFTGVTPATMAQDAGPTLATFAGTGFTPQHRCMLANQEQPTTYVSATALTIVVYPDQWTATGKVAAVREVNKAPFGTTQTLTITEPEP